MTVSRQLQYFLQAFCNRWLALVSLGILLISSWSFPAIAWAQALPEAPTVVELSAEQTTLGRTSPDSNDIPSGKVNQFVQAFLQVLDLIERREGELQGAETESESLRIQREIETEALEIIAAAGLTKTEYLQLLGLANTDSEFGERVVAQLQEPID